MQYQHRARDYKHSITIQQLDDSTTDTDGSVIETWSNYAAGVRARIETVSGREYYQNNREVGEELIRFFIHYDSSYAGVTPKHRVVFNSQNYKIEYAPDFDMKRSEIILHCSKVS